MNHELFEEIKNFMDAHQCCGLSEELQAFLYPSPPPCCHDWQPAKNMWYKKNTFKCAKCEEVKYETVV